MVFSLNTPESLAILFIILVGSPSFELGLNGLQPFVTYQLHHEPILTMRAGLLTLAAP